jgi:ribosomal protein S18 acetylase RimI-like enzyme
MAILIRDATLDDHGVIVDFNIRLALETEHKTLSREVVNRGVAQALAEPDRLRYWVAVDDSVTSPQSATVAGPNPSRLVVGQLAITREWSDWRDGWIWWYQSVYVDADYRGRGVFRALHRHVRALARSLPEVIGLRLYVEENNARAQETYRALGFVPGGHHVFDHLWIDGT